LAVNRRTNRSASLKSCSRPRGARLENACAKCTHVGFQFQPDRPPVLGRRLHHRRAGFSSSALASATTTIKTLLCTSIPATFIDSSWRASGRTHAKKITHRHVLPPPSRPEWRDTDWFKTRVPDQTQKWPHFIQSANRPSPSTLHQRTRTTQPHFHVNRWAAGP
jgi:hypothetical protein